LGGIAYGFYYWRSRQILERNAALQMQDLRTAEDHSNKELQDQKSSLVTELKPPSPTYPKKKWPVNLPQASPTKFKTVKFC
jgi:hypothetical protein